MVCVGPHWLIKAEGGTNWRLRGAPIKAEGGTNWRLRGAPFDPSLSSTSGPTVQGRVPINTPLHR